MMDGLGMIFRDLIHTSSHQSGYTDHLCFLHMNELSAAFMSRFFLSLHTLYAQYLSHFYEPPPSVSIG